MKFHLSSIHKFNPVLLNFTMSEAAKIESSRYFKAKLGMVKGAEKGDENGFYDKFRGQEESQGRFKK